MTAPASPPLASETAARSAPPFRYEALEAQRCVGWLGEISLLRPLSSWVLTAAGAAIAAIVLALLCFGRYAERARVTGQLLPVQGVTTLHAPVQGAVERVLVEEGAQVEAGALLAVLGHPRSAPDAVDVPAARRELLRTRRRSLEDALAARLALLANDEQSIAAQSDGLQVAVDGLQRELALRREQLAGLQDIAARFAALGDRRHAGALQVREAQGRVLTQRAEIEALQRQLESQRAKRAELRQTLASVDARRAAARAEFERDSAALGAEDIELSLQARSAIRAPLDGVVAARLVEPGQGVAAGTPLLILMASDDALEAHLQVPSRAIARVRPGSSVRLRLPAFPYQRHGHLHGTVLRMSQAALTQSPAGDPMHGADSHYRVVVALDSQRVPHAQPGSRLLPGMRIEADLFGEPRRLGEWLLGPFDAARDGIAAP